MRVKTIADLLIEYLELIGVEYIFGIPGGAIEPLFNAVYHSNIKHILTKHESGAAFMASGYAKVSGKLGVCVATSGPGATNLITGVASAYLNNTPLLVLTGQVSTDKFGIGAFQDSSDCSVDLTTIFSHLTKKSKMIVNSKNAAFQIEDMIKTATMGVPGPVHLSLPIDIMRSKSDARMAKENTFLNVKTKIVDLDGVNKITSLIKQSSNIAVLIGKGAILSDSYDNLLEFVEDYSLPIATTVGAKGYVPENHPLSLGCFGFASNGNAEEYFANNKIDLLLAFGTSFNEWGTNGWCSSISKIKKIVHVDLDYSKINRVYNSIGVIGDISTTIREILTELKRQNMVKNKFPKIKPEKSPILNKQKFKLPFTNQKEDRINPCELISEIRESFSDDTIFFADVGNNLAWMINQFECRRPNTFFADLAFGSMGFGVASVIGAKLASPDTPVCAVVGDGGFMMNGMEVATAVDNNIPVIWIVLNDSKLGMVYHGQKLSPNAQSIGCDFHKIDAAQIADGHGAKGINICKTGTLTRGFIEQVISLKRPTVIDVSIDGDIVPPIFSRINSLNKEKAI